MKASASRKTFLDFLRIIACFLVIVNHTCEPIFSMQKNTNLTWFISITYFFICKIAVPIFIMISGYLLLGKNDTWKKCFQRISRIVLALFSCAVVYSVFNNVLNYPNISALNIITDIFSFYRKTPSMALWYLYTYMGLLLMLPFLQKMNSAMTKKDYHIFFAISGTFTALFPILTQYNNLISYNKDFLIPLFNGCICMLFLGQYLARFGIKKSKVGFIAAFVLFVTAVALNVFLTYLEFIKTSGEYMFFDNIQLLPILIESICVFYMASFIKFSDKISSVISYIGACTFGIYLMSDLLIRCFSYYIWGYTPNTWSTVLITEFGVFGFGLIITAILRKIPIIKTLL